MNLEGHVLEYKSQNLLLLLWFCSLPQFDRPSFHLGAPTGYLQWVYNIDTAHPPRSHRLPFLLPILLLQLLGEVTPPTGLEAVNSPKPANLPSQPCPKAWTTSKPPLAKVRAGSSGHDITLTTQVSLLKRTPLPRPLPVILQVINPCPSVVLCTKSTQFHTRAPLPPYSATWSQECHYLMFTHSLNIFVSSVMCDFATPWAAAWHFHRKVKKLFYCFHCDSFPLGSGIVPKNNKGTWKTKMSNMHAEQPPPTP